MKTQVVLLSGKQGSGKTTTMRHLVQIVKRQSTMVSCITFAKPLYDMHDYCREYLAHLGIQPAGVKDGNLLQLLGTEWIRKTLGADTLVKAAQGKIGQDRFHALSLGFSRHIVIVSDCRFQNEFNAFPDALRIRLEAHPEVRKERAEMWRENDQHQSEVDLDGYALEGKFDATYWTDGGTNSPNHIATMIAAQLDKDSWREKRK